MLTLVVITKGVNGQPNTQEASNAPGGIETTNLTEELNGVVQGIHVATKKNTSGMSLLKNAVEPIAK